LASTQEVAQRLADCVGVQYGVTTCKKLGGDYRLFGGGGHGASRAGAGLLAKAPARAKGKGSTGRSAGGFRRKALGPMATRASRIAKAAKRAGRLGVFEQGKARMFIAGIPPVSLYGAEHEPWTGQEVLAIEKQAVRALRLRAPGVPHAIARLMLPEVAADPAFRIHFAAIERWSRELWATAYRQTRNFLGVRRVQQDAFTPQEIVQVWKKIRDHDTADLIMEGGPIGAMVQAAAHFSLDWTAVAQWGHPVMGPIDITEGTPAMLKHVLGEQRTKDNEERFLLASLDRRTAVAARDRDADDFTLEQAIGGEVEWEVVAEMATKGSTTNDIKRVLAAITWDVLPTGLWMSRHGWEVEVVCGACGRTDDLRHALGGCGRAETLDMNRWKTALQAPPEGHGAAMAIEDGDSG
jgi:hypothetical protein